MKRYIRNGVLTGLTSMMLWGGAPNTALAQDQYLGEMRFFAGNFAPYGWVKCDGQLLYISEHQSLYSVIGTIYGGDGRVTFGLPDMRGRTIVSAGLANYGDIGERAMGQRGGGQPLKAATDGTASERTQDTLAVQCIIALIGNLPTRN